MGIYMKNHILGSLGNNEDKPSFFLAAKYNVSMNTAEVLKDAENPARSDGNRL